MEDYNGDDDFDNSNNNNNNVDNDADVYDAENDDNHDDDDDINIVIFVYANIGPVNFFQTQKRIICVCVSFRSMLSPPAYKNLIA